MRRRGKRSAIPPRFPPLSTAQEKAVTGELADLAADIKANGLIHPIMLDPTGETVIDGRNRLRACEIAGVEPNFEKIETDPAAFIVSANLNRRNLTKGQQAMALAMIYPDPERGRGKKDAAKKGAETASFSYRRVKEARQILDHSREYARAVIAGDMSLDEALLKVRQAQNKIQEVVDEVESEEARELAETARKSAELRSKAPDLADLVADEKMPLNEAHAAMQERERQNEIKRQVGMKAAERVGADLANTVGSIVAAVNVGAEIIISDEIMEEARDAMSRLEEIYGSSSRAAFGGCPFGRLQL